MHQEAKQHPIAGKEVPQRQQYEMEQTTKREAIGIFSVQGKQQISHQIKQFSFKKREDPDKALNNQSGSTPKCTVSKVSSIYPSKTTVHGNS